MDETTTHIQLQAYHMERKADIFKQPSQACHEDLVWCFSYLGSGICYNLDILLRRHHQFKHEKTYKVCWFTFHRQKTCFYMLVIKVCCNEHWRSMILPPKDRPRSSISAAETDTSVNAGCLVSVEDYSNHNTTEQGQFWTCCYRSDERPDYRRVGPVSLTDVMNASSSAACCSKLIIITLIRNIWLRTN